MIAKIENVKAFEVNSGSRRMSDLSIFLTIVIDYFGNSNNFNISYFSICILRLIHYSQVFYLLNNKSYVIIPDLPLSGIFYYYLVFISTILQKITLEPDLSKLILYVLSSFLSIKNNTENNKNLDRKKRQKSL